VRAGIVQEPGQWKWSSYYATAYSVSPPEFLVVDWLLGQFGKKKNEARKVYRQFVREGMLKRGGGPWQKLVGQIIFGGAEFVADIQSRISDAKEIGEIPRAQRFPARPALSVLFPLRIAQDKGHRNEQIKAAHIQYGYTLKEIAEQLNIHYSTVSKIIHSQ